MDKTKMMSNTHVPLTPMKIGHSTFKIVDDILQLYLGQIIQLGRCNFEKEVNHRIQLGCTAFASLPLRIQNDTMSHGKSPVYVASDDLRH